MATTAKLALSSKTDNNEQVQLSFVPDYADGRNKEWAKYTPSLSLVMNVLPEVAEKFISGQAYVMTLEEAAD